MTSSNEVVTVHVPQLDISIEAWVLPATPLVLGLRSLIKEDGCKFAWDDPEEAILKKGRLRIRLPVLQGVPVLKA